MKSVVNGVVQSGTQEEFGWVKEPAMEGYSGLGWAKATGFSSKRPSKNESQAWGDFSA